MQIFCQGEYHTKGFLKMEELVFVSSEPGVFSERCTEKLPLRVDFIHRVEFGEVSGHRVLIKRGPGNRGASQRGSTHEATSGMSSRDRSFVKRKDWSK